MSFSAESLEKSYVALFAANLFPLLGVLIWNWDIFSIIFLYWFENVLIGLFNILKMITCSPSTELLQFHQSTRTRCGHPTGPGANSPIFDSAQPVFHLLSKLFMIPFFMFHYGIFCVVHGMFVFILFGREKLAENAAQLSDYLSVITNSVWIPISLMFFSYLYSYIFEFIGNGEYRTTLVYRLFMQPYPRIIILHVTIILGGIAIAKMGSPIAALLLLIVGKTILDLYLTIRLRSRQTGQTDVVCP